MFYKIETHLHSNPVSQCATDSAEMMVEAFVKAGYYGIIVTDHFIMDRKDVQGKCWEELVELQQKGYRAAVEAAKGTGLAEQSGCEQIVLSWNILQAPEENIHIAEKLLS